MSLVPLVCPKAFKLNSFSHAFTSILFQIKTSQLPNLVRMVPLRVISVSIITICEMNKISWKRLILWMKQKKKRILWFFSSFYSIFVGILIDACNIKLCICKYASLYILSPILGQIVLDWWDVFLICCWFMK